MKRENMHVILIEKLRIEHIQSGREEAAAHATHSPKDVQTPSARGGGGDVEDDGNNAEGEHSKYPKAEKLELELNAWNRSCECSAFNPKLGG